MIAFFTNRLNHHQVQVADELYKITNGDFAFVELCPPNSQSNKGSNADFSERAYKAINPRICDKVDIFRVTIRPHDWVNVAQNLGCHLGWNLYHVSGLRVVKQGFENLRRGK